MTLTEILFLFITTASAFFTALAQTALWQQKEYRLDRMRSYLKSPQRVNLISRLLILSLGFLGIAWLSLLVKAAFLSYALSVFTLILILAHHLYRAYRKGVSRPIVTAKAVSIFILSVGTFFFLASYFSPYLVLISLPLQWSTFLALMPLIVAASVAVTNIPFAIRKNQIIRRASLVRNLNKNIVVIGVTGSLGKTSTKHFLARLLASENTIVTKLHNNTEIGVALDLIDQLKQPTKIYIVEMSAYRLGEIDALAQLVKPSVGLLTKISNQHIDLFGSQNNINEAKWELIDNLPVDGTAVLNLDDPIQIRKAKNIKQKTIWYSIKKQADVWAEDINIDPHQIECTIHIYQTAKKITLPIVSEGLLTSVVAAIATATAMNIDPLTIWGKISDLKPFSQTMEVRSGILGSTIVDDSYSANEAGVVNAIRHLNRFPNSDKRIIFLPLIELGDKAKPVHENLGKLLAESGAKVFVYGEAYMEDLLRGFNTSGNPGNIDFVKNHRDLLSSANKNLSENSVVLLEGRIPNVVREALLLS